jgi:hypothetical protein
MIDLVIFFVDFNGRNQTPTKNHSNTENRHDIRIYLSQRKLPEESGRLVSIPKFEAWVHFHICTTVLCGDKDLVGSEVLWVRV